MSHSKNILAHRSFLITIHDKDTTITQQFDRKVQRKLPQLFLVLNPDYSPDKFARSRFYYSFITFKFIDQCLGHG